MMKSLLETKLWDDESNFLKIFFNEIPLNFSVCVC